LAKRTLDETYTDYKSQIDAIINLPGMKGRQAARIIAWFYGGKESGWRSFLVKKGATKKVSKEVEQLLSAFRKK
jgi:hypothetical protein